MAPKVPSGWRKSSRTTGANNCVEIGRVGNTAAVRDTKDRAAGYFTATGTQWATFIDSIKTGRFER